MAQLLDRSSIKQNLKALSDHKSCFISQHLPLLKALHRSSPIMLSKQLKTVTSRAAVSRTSCAIAPPALRTYAQAGPAQDTKPPVALYGLDGTYASALVCLRYPYSPQKIKAIELRSSIRVTECIQSSIQLRPKHQRSKPHQSLSQP